MGGNFVMASRHLNICNQGQARDAESLLSATNDMLTVLSDRDNVKMFQNMALFSAKILSMSLVALEAIGIHVCLLCLNAILRSARILL